MLQVHGEVAVECSAGFALVRDGTDVNITLIPAKQVKMPMGLGGINNQLRTTLRTFPLFGGSSLVVTVHPDAATCCLLSSSGLSLEVSRASWLLNCWAVIFFMPRGLLVS